MKIALCQFNPITGNIAHNTRRIVEELQYSARAGAQLAILTELAITGYPPKDLLEYESFYHEAMEGLTAIQSACREFHLGCIVGTIHTNFFGGKKELLNAAAFISSAGEISFNFKKLLPTYDVFDESRYFHPCPMDVPPSLLDFPDADLRLGVTICEDIWNDNEFWKDERLYEDDPVERLADSGANFIINISASPYVLGKPQRRLEMLRHTARRWKLPVLIVNQVGGCDQIIFDGGSAVVMPDGTVPCFAGWFEEKTVVWDSTKSSADDPRLAPALKRMKDDVAAIHDALILGLRDYLRKTNFRQVLVGNSGGIDSAVVLALCTAALCKDHVISVSMPGPFTSEETRSDSARLAQNLGLRHLEIPISGPFDAMQKILRSGGSPVVPLLFENDPALICGVADENLQARLRGNILMWISNAIASPPTLVVSTGNKSEIAAGYCTLYGDMAGGLALISDVPKMMVYKLARFLNGYMGDPIPQSIIDREPTAELAPNQKDTDSIPPYPIVDQVIRMYVEERQGLAQIVASGIGPEEIVRRIVRMIDATEYKRAQAAPGLKVTSKAFGFGRRMPIARG